MLLALHGKLAQGAIFLSQNFSVNAPHFSLLNFLSKSLTKKGGLFAKPCLAVFIRFLLPLRIDDAE